MPIRKILSLVAGRGHDDRVLDFAALLARRFDAHVEALLVRPNPRDAAPLFVEGMTGSAFEQIMEEIERDSAQAAAAAKDAYERWRDRHRLAPAAGPGSASAGWHEETGSETDRLARRGRLADLIVIGRPTEDRNGPSIITAEAALLETGRPVVLVPPGGVPAPPQRLAIAWNGSIEASRAVALAMPFIHRADRVAIVTVDEASGLVQSARELADYLRWHGAEAQVEAVEPGGDGTGADILGAAARLGTDLLVMGAYTHSRLRELIFGGATLHILYEAPLPVLMVS